MTKLFELNNYPEENFKMYIMLVLCKIKTNLTFFCLSVLFGMSKSSCTRFFYKYLIYLRRILEPMIYWPTKEILRNMPKHFQKFKSTRIVLDATEISLQRLKCLHCRNVTYSHYKSRHTIKFLIGITPAGHISFVSRPFGGRASDKAIFVNEELIKKLDPNDAIMVDKGIID